MTPAAPAPAHSRSRTLALLAALAIAAVYVTLRLPGIRLPLDRDEGAFAYIGQIINEGGMPYRDALDHKPPVAFYLNALALRLAPPTPQGIHLFLLFYNALTLVCLFATAKLLFRSVRAGLCCAFAFAVFSASPAIHGFTASTEMYALLPTTLSLFLALRAALRAAGKFPGIQLFLSGIFGAAACWTKQTAFTTVFFVFLLICRAARRQKSPRPIALWLTGAILFSAAVASYFSFGGVFSSFIYWCFTYESAYAAVPLTDTRLKMQEIFIQIARGDFVFPAAGIAVALLSLIRRNPHGGFLLGLLLFSFAGTIPGHTYPHYFVQLAPAVALSGGYAFFLLLGLIARPNLKIAAASLFGALVIAQSVTAGSRYFFASSPADASRFYFGGNPFAQSQAVAAWLSSRTAPPDRVLIIGSEPQILVYSERRSSSPFLMIYPLTIVHSRYREFQAQMWTDVQIHPPKYIVAVSGIRTSIAWDGEADLLIVRQLCGFLAGQYTLTRRDLVDRSEEADESEEAEYKTGTCLDQDQPSLDVYEKNHSTNQK